MCSGVQDFIVPSSFDVLSTDKKTVPAKEISPSPVDSATESPKQRAVRPVESKKPAKAKKEKAAAAAPVSKAPTPARKEVSVNSLACQVDVDGFREFLASMQTKHAADEVLQLQCVCDFLRSVFATVSVPFSAMLQSMVLRDVAGFPWNELPGPMKKELTSFVASKQSAALGSYLCQVCFPANSIHQICRRASGNYALIFFEIPKSLYFGKMPTDAIQMSRCNSHRLIEFLKNSIIQTLLRSSNFTLIFYIFRTHVSLATSDTKQESSNAQCVSNLLCDGLVQIIVSSSAVGSVCVKYADVFLPNRTRSLAYFINTALTWYMDYFHNLMHHA